MLTSLPILTLKIVQNLIYKHIDSNIVQGENFEGEEFKIFVAIFNSGRTSKKEQNKWYNKYKVFRIRTTLINSIYVNRFVMKVIR